MGAYRYRRAEVEDALAAEVYGCWNTFRPFLDSTGFLGMPIDFLNLESLSSPVGTNLFKVPL